MKKSKLLKGKNNFLKKSLIKKNKRKKFNLKKSIRERFKRKKSIRKKFNRKKSIRERFKRKKRKSTRKRKKPFLGKSLIKTKIQRGGEWSSYYEHTGNNRGFIQQFERYKLINRNTITLQNVEFTLPHLDVGIFQQLVNNNYLEINKGKVGILKDKYESLKFKGVMSVLCEIKSGRILSKKRTDKKIVEVLYDPTVLIQPDANLTINDDNSISFKVTELIGGGKNKEYIFTDKFDWLIDNHLGENPICKGKGDLNPNLSDYIIEKDVDNFRIVIYPDPNPRFWRAWLFEDTFFEELKTSVFKAKHINDEYFNNLIKDLYNSFESSNEITKVEEILKGELNRSVDALNHMISQLTIDDAEKIYLKTKLTDFVTKKIDTKIQNLFNQPNCNLRFVVVFLEKNEDGKYKPMVHHLSQITENHTMVLTEAQRLLDEVLPLKLGYKVPNINYLAYNLPGFFCIKVSYFHPVQTSFDFPSYQIQNMITLNEIIFGSTLVNDAPFFSKLKRIYYIVNNYWLTPIKPAAYTKVEQPKTTLQKMAEIQKKTGELNKKIERMSISSKTYGDDSVKDKTFFNNCEIIKLDQGIVGSSIMIYLKKNEKFYKVVLEGNLNNIKRELLKSLESISNHTKIFECNNNEVYTVIMTVPVYKIIYLTEITSDTNPSDTNPFGIVHSFPTMMNKINFKEVAEVDQQISELQLLDYYPKISLELFLQKKGDPTTVRQIYEEFELVLNINTYYLRILNDLVGTGIKKKVVWIMKIKTDSFKTFKTFKTTLHTTFKDKDRLKDIYDLQGNELNEIIKTLIEKNVYNPNDEFLGVNNSMALSMNSLHLHILPKTSNLYTSIITAQQFNFPIEIRMRNALNIDFNLLADPNYYIKFKKANQNNRLLSSIKFNYI